MLGHETVRSKDDNLVADKGGFSPPACFHYTRRDKLLYLFLLMVLYMLSRQLFSQNKD